MCLLSSCGIFSVPPLLCWSCLTSDQPIQCSLGQLLTFYKLPFLCDPIDCICSEDLKDGQGHSSAAYTRLSYSFSKTWNFLFCKKNKRFRHASIILFQAPKSWRNPDRCSSFHFRFWSPVGVRGFEELPNRHFVNDLPSSQKYKLPEISQSFQKNCYCKLTQFSCDLISQVDDSSNVKHL